MKLIKTLHKFSIPLLTSSLFLECMALIFIAATIWLGGPLLAWKEMAPLAQSEKRFYLIICLLLVWLLKILIIDLETPAIFRLSNPETKNKLCALQSRFAGVLKFMLVTANKYSSSKHLYELPWYLFIGPSNTGKTTLLANSKTHFILQRHFQPQQIQNIPSSENCDWWITRDATIIDIPGKYLAPPPSVKMQGDKSAMYALLWRFFLRLVKKQRGKKALNGIIIALSLTEIMQQGDPKKSQARLRQLLLRIHEIQAFFPQPLPYYLVITKCDLLSGFTEFFADSTDEEITQAWGVTLPPVHDQFKIDNLFIERFNALIKKLNQQLLWRLHQERNPMTRPYIKDFPLQVERLKEFILDFIKKLSAVNTSLALRGVYLTSALQQNTESEIDIIEEPNTTQHAIQIIKEPTPTSRAYFIKQFISHGLMAHKKTHTALQMPTSWKLRTAYAASIGIIGLASILFGKDFEKGVKQAYSVQNILSDYQLALQKTQDPDEHLAKTLNFLSALQQTAIHPDFKIDNWHILAFYSRKSKEKSYIVYQHALQNILLPELKNYLGDYLKSPVNKNTEYVYAALKAYLMLGDTAHFQADFISNTTRPLLPKSLSEADATALMNHINIALQINSTPLPLDTLLIQETRKYLTSLPSFQLGYIILKNIDSNNLMCVIPLGTTPHTTNAAFVSYQTMNQIPHMFTAKAFSNIISEETMVAAQESTIGNWVLGSEFVTNNSANVTASLGQQLRSTYISHYVDTWENLLANIHLSQPADLTQTNAIIGHLISNDSPLIQLLQTLHDNTYFEPIASASPTLQNLGLLMDKNNAAGNLLYQIFSGLQALHQQLHAILTAENERKAAFELVSTRMQHTHPDSITQLRLIAEKSPEPIKTWLNKITNMTWHFLLQEATRYMDTSWQEQVGRIYQLEIANHYPFSPNATREVALNKFTDFFGNPGIVLRFYNQYLLPFIDTTTPDWHWRSIDDQKPPFSDEILHQLQTALHIHHLFFPNGDNKLYVQFALQSYSLSKDITFVKLNINDKKVIDQGNGSHHSHLLTWPNKHDTKMTSVQLTMSDQKTVNRDFPGDWGWFKLVNQSFVGTIAHKATLINFSNGTDHSAQYLLYTQGSFNPFLSLNLQKFHLPPQLIEMEKTHA